tara:strand:- start:795 stop:2339 length:1545 start_codon:yes stop_codon:yes gene_type:complete
LAAYNLLKNTFELHPFLFGVFTTIFIFIFNIHIVKFPELILPLTTIIFTIIILTILIKSVLKNKKKTAMIITIGSILFFSYGHFYEIIENEVGTFSHSYLLIAFLILFVIGSVYFIRTKIKLDNLTKIVNVIGVTIIIISMINLGIYFIEDTPKIEINELENENLQKNNFSNNLNSPDIYYIILDAYAGQESLENTFNFDNTEFYDFLIENNFYVAKQGYANYEETYKSLSSSLNMNYINEIDSYNLQKRIDLGYEMIENNKVMSNLKSKEYKIINFFSGWGPTRDMPLADLNVCNEYRGILDSEFFSMVINKSILDPFYVKLFENDRKELLSCHIEKIKNIQKISDKPIFVFAHITIPHGPYIFGPNGEHITPTSIQLGDKGDDKEKYIGQLQYTNKLMKDVINTILNSEKYVKNSPIIVIQGDHASGIVRFENMQEDGLQDIFSILIAIHAPQIEKNIFEEKLTPVNTFRHIFNTYFEDDYPILEQKQYKTLPESPWKFVDVTDIVMKKTED